MQHRNKFLSVRNRISKWKKDKIMEAPPTGEAFMLN